MLNLQLPQKLAHKFIWMLRSDLRKGASVKSDPPPSFTQWWLVQGRSEYPAWNTLEFAEREWLSERTIPFELENHKLNLPRAFGLVIKLRADVRSKFTNDGRLDQVALLAWFLMMGIKEHALEEIVDVDLIKNLDLVLLENKSISIKRNGRLVVPRINVLMYLIWYLLDSEVKKSMALDQEISREKFLIWFFCVAVKQYPIAPLLSPRWKHWLIQDVSVDGNSTPAVPRFALYEQQFNPELKKQFPLETPNGLNGLVAWSKKALSNSAEWAWLKHHKSNAEKKLGDEKVISSSENELLANKKVFGINLFGFAFGELGIGEDLRMAVAVCEAAKVPYRVININAGATLRQADEQLKQEVADSVNQAPYAINLFCMPAFDMVSRIFLKMGPEVFQNHYNIGWWPWELSVWPKAWKSVFELVDEVWAGSQFTLNTYQKNTLKPCFHMPLAVSVDRAKTYTRKHFGLHKNSFTYLYVLDFNSSLKRKNPISLINAFQQAFSISDKSVALIFKVMNVQAQNPDWLEFKELCGADPRIKILDQTMDRPEVLGLIQICDAYVSPHCAEGFGRTLAEAMLFGKPVIATNYSGNVDFMNPKYTFPVNYQLVSVTEGDYHFVEADDQAEWAQISITELAQQMAAARESAKRPEYCEDLKLFAKSQFDIDIAAKLLKSRVAQIKKQLI